MGNEPFTGEDNDAMDPRDFLKRTQHYLMATAWDDDDKINYFETWLKSGSSAELWFRGLEAMKKATWKELCMAFKERWPERPIVQKTTAEKQAELEGERIKEAELGTKVKVNGTETYTHIAWANKVEKLAKAIPDNNNLLVVGCRRQLPPTLKALVSSSHDTWTSFCAAVHTIRPLDIEEEKERQDKQAQIEGELQRVRQQQQRQPPTTPSSALGQAFRNFSVGPIPQPRFQPATTNSAIQGPTAHGCRKARHLSSDAYPLHTWTLLQGGQHTRLTLWSGIELVTEGLQMSQDPTRSHQAQVL